VAEVNALIKRFRFVARDGSDLPAFSGGAHTVVEMDDHGTRRLNPYSLMSDPEDRSGYEISVRRDDGGRGGSLYMHRHVVPGMEMVLSHPVNLFPLDNRARKHLMIAGGIGITPFRSILLEMIRTGGLHYPVVVLYANRRPQDAAFLDELRELAREDPNLTIVPTMSGITAEDGWAGELGHIDGVDRARPVVRHVEKVGRNDPCPCGSGKKYKKCHGEAA